MGTTKAELDAFARAFNKANIQDDVPMQNRAKDGASIVFGAMNGYLWLLQKDNKELTQTDQYKNIRDAFQDVANWFLTDWDVEEWKTVKGRGKGRVKIELEPKEEK